MILWFVYNVSEVWDWLVYCAWYEGFPSLFFSPVLFSGTNSLGWGFSPPPPSCADHQSFCFSFSMFI